MRELHLIPDPRRLEESLALAEEYGAHFEYNDFFQPQLLDDPDQCRERVRLYCALGRDRSLDTLHGAFLDVTVHSEDAQIRAVSEKRVWQSMEIAGMLGVRGVVFHTGLIPNFRSPAYIDGWIERNQAFWLRVCARYPELDIFLENMFDTVPAPLGRLAQAMRDTANFGLCLDYAHAQVFGGGGTPWVEALAPYVRHMHINDNDGLDDRHEAVGDGVTDWARFNAALRKAELAPSVLVETSSLEKQRRSLLYMRQYGVYPFDREGRDAEC